MEKVAIIGSGPGGLAAARYLKTQGFTPEIFDSHSSLGGQWDHTNTNSGVWPQMVTNTLLEATRFSDLEYPSGTPLFPHNETVLEHLRAFAAKYDLLENAKFGCQLTRLEQVGTEYELTFIRDNDEFVSRFGKVVVATGRYNKPMIPKISGLEVFKGQGGVIHAFNYKDPDAFRDLEVVVAGGSISALEIASDLSMLGAKKVYLAQRRQRYVFPKMVKGTALEYFAFNYEGATVIADGTVDEGIALGRHLAEELAGDPSRYGTPKVHSDFLKAGATGSQHYLNLVAEGRVHPVPWIETVGEHTIELTDGANLAVDAIIIGTGFDLNLPFLSDEISQTLNLNSKGIDLHQFTFHPDLPGLAFVGMWSQQGSYPTVLEQQARYIAYAWSGEIEVGDTAALEKGVHDCISERHHADYRNQNEMALRFARLCGTDPNGEVSSKTMEVIRASATTGLLYRIVGPDAFEDGKDRLRKQFKKYGPR